VDQGKAAVHVLEAIFNSYTRHTEVSNTWLSVTQNKKQEVRQGSVQPHSILRLPGRPS